MTQPMNAVSSASVRLKNRLDPKKPSSPVRYGLWANTPSTTSVQTPHQLTPS